MRYIVYILTILLFISICFIIYLLGNKQEHNINISEPEKVIIKGYKEIEEKPITNHKLPVNPIINPSYTSNEFQLVGTLTSIEQPTPIILPLFGKRLRRDRWQYYTTTEKESYIKLDILNDKQDCTDIIGCNQIENEAIVFVVQYNQGFKASIYKFHF